LPDGKVIVVGDVYRDYCDFKDPGSHVVLIRYNADGSLDETFADNGKLLLDLNCKNSYGIDIIMQKDNKILVACRSFDSDFPSVTIVRLNYDGTLDQDFGNAGVVKELSIYPNWSNFFRIFCQYNDKIITVGNIGISEVFNDGSIVFKEASFFIARYIIMAFLI